MTIKIKVKNLNFYYGSFQALKDINIDIHENRITALIGPSGCGKSTFIKTIDRMYDLIEDTKADGTIAFEGINVLDENTDVVELRMSVDEALKYVISMGVVVPSGRVADAATPPVVTPERAASEVKADLVRLEIEGKSRAPD